MTQLQRRLLELPLVLMFVWFFHSFEISIFELPYGTGSVQLIPVLITYFSLTRSWGQLTILAFGFGLIGAFTTGVPLGIYLAACVWTGLLTRALVSEFALEGRRSFMFMVFSSHLFNKSLIWFLLRIYNLQPPLMASVSRGLLSAICIGILGYLIFPILLRWDEFFEHAPYESRDINPGFLRS